MAIPTQFFFVVYRPPKTNPDKFQEAIDFQPLTTLLHGFIHL